MRLFVEDLTPAGRIHWTAPVRPFFAAVVERVSPEGSDPPESTQDPLEWFVGRRGA